MHYRPLAEAKGVTAAIGCNALKQFRDGETTIKIQFGSLRGEGAERKIIPNALFSWEAPQQYNFESANLIVENCEAANPLQAPKPRKKLK